MNTCNFSTNLDAMADLAKPGVVVIDLAKPEVVMIDLAKPEGGGGCFVMIGFAKPESGGIVFVDRVGAFRPPSGVGFCTSERAECQCAAYTIDVPALRFRRNTRHTFPGSSRHMFRGNSLGSLCCVHLLGMTLSAKPGVVMIDLAKPEGGGDCFVMIGFAKPGGGGGCFVMIGFAKPESGGIVFVDRVGAFRPPSGAGLRTSERAECLCAAYTIDVPALRFRRNARHMFRGNSLGSLCCVHLLGMTLSAKHGVVMIDFAKPEGGGIVFVDRVGAFRPPSGVGFCTSERAECLCAAYTIDAPALRFRGTSFLSLPHDVSSGMSLSPL